MTALSADALATLFSGAHTHNLWHERPVSDETLRQLYEAMKWAPTAANACPARIVFVRSGEQKERLLQCMAEGNVEKTRAAPVTAIFAFDSHFYDKLPVLYPQVDARSWFAGDAVKAEGAARLNAGLQGGYFILAARAVGLDCGPMAGFDAARVNETFFADGQWKVLFVCNLGYGDPAGVRPRNPRLDFDEACRIV